MDLNLAQKLIQSHLIEGEMRPGEQIGLRMDQTLVQDATGTLVMLTLEAIRLERIKTDFAVQYVDHNLLQEDHRNPEDHIFLESAAKRFGLWFSPPGNGVSHPLHQAFFGVPGQSLIGSDSHTPAAGALGMLAFGAGGMDVAMALAGEPYRIPTPKIWGIRLTGKLSYWVSAKDVVLEMLRRHGVDGGLGKIIEYHGPGLAHLSAMDRHVIANMGTELGATTTVFPSDGAVEYYLAEQGREADWQELSPDEGATYDFHDEIDLSELEPLIALPSSPDNVVPVREVAGKPIYQAYIGSSANPGHRDFAIAAEMVRGQHIASGVSLDINPTSRVLLEGLIRDGHLTQLLRAGARLHQAGCNGCIGMGQAPAKGRNSLRTVPRNFPARSGTREDSIFLCSPETATASALRGVITDPRDLELTVVDVRRPTPRANKPDIFVKPLSQAQAKDTALVKGGNIQALPALEPMPDRLYLPILIKAEDNISTDEIMPAGPQVLPFRSNIQKLAEFALRDLDEAYATKANEAPANFHMIVGGENYGQGSSREHAALAPRYLGLRVVLAKSFARIHRQNLINYGVLPLIFDDTSDYERMSCGQIFSLMDVPDEIRRGMLLELILEGEEDKPVRAVNNLDAREREIVLAGGMINWYQENRAT